MLWNIRDATNTEKVILVPFLYNLHKKKTLSIKIFFQVKFKEKFMEEVRFIAKCHGSTKPVNKRESVDEGEGKDDDLENSEHFQPGSTNYGWIANGENKVAIP